MTFRIYLDLPTLNEAIRTAKGHWSNWHRLKKKAGNAARWQIRDQFNGQLVPSPVAITFVWPIRPNADLDNVAAIGSKIIIDALVDEGVLVDDSAKHVVALHHWAGKHGGPIILAIEHLSEFQWEWPTRPPR